MTTMAIKTLRITHRCDVCGLEIETRDLEAALQLENEWYISPFTDFCSECRNSEYAARVIKVENVLLERKRAEKNAPRK